MKQHSGAVVSTVTLQQKGPGFSSWEHAHSAWSLHVLPVSCVALLQVLMVFQQSKNMYASRDASNQHPRPTDEDLDLVPRHCTAAAHCFLEEDGPNAEN